MCLILLCFGRTSLFLFWRNGPHRNGKSHLHARHRVYGPAKRAFNCQIESLTRAVTFGISQPHIVFAHFGVIPPGYDKQMCKLDTNSPATQTTELFPTTLRDKPCCNSPDLNFTACALQPEMCFWGWSSLHLQRLLSMLPVRYVFPFHWFEYK